MIVEDLTKQNYQMLCFARDASVTEKAWTKRGKTIIKAKNGKIKQINQRSDLDDPSLRGEPHRTSGQGQNTRRSQPPSGPDATRHRNLTTSELDGELAPGRESSTRHELSASDSETDNKHEDEDMSEINSKHEYDSDEEEGTPAEKIWT